MTHEIDAKVKQYIKDYQLIDAGDEIVVGVSGGADSMMLLHFLNRYQETYHISLKIAHIHHGIRKEADEDTAYVEQIARLWKIPCQVKYCKIQELARLWGMTEEEAGRKVRYDFFISLTNERGKIATAHNMNDQAETMLMRFIRGTDIQGLRGIPPKRGQIIRPILGLTREEVEYYCKRWEIHYKQDQTNFETIYTRNKLRIECIPYIKEHLNPNFVKTMARQSQSYDESNAFLKQYTEEVFEKVAVVQTRQVVLDKQMVQKEKMYIQKRLFLEAISRLLGHTKEMTTIHLMSITTLLNKQAGKKINLPYKMIVTNERNQLIFHFQDEGEMAEYAYPLQMGKTRIHEPFLTIHMDLVTSKTFEQRQENMYTKYIDYDKIKDSLQIRNRQPSDQITLPGGTKKLKKFFVDEKIPGHLKNTIPMIADGKDIVWVIGSRLNSKYYVTDKTTKILELTVLKEHTLQEGLC
ncbi:MAG: tRNA lysidine(34) synthetase TilS [Cellulosilyticaceae bacterium]